MPSQVLAPTTAAGASSDITVAGGSTTTVALYAALNDNLILPAQAPFYNGDFLLPDGVSVLLLPSQAGDALSFYDEFEIRIKDPLGVYNPSGMYLRSFEPFKVLGPGTWQVTKPITAEAIGIQTN